MKEFRHSMDIQALSRSLEEFLAASAAAVVLEDGAVAFDLRDARYSVSSQHDKCLLHLWSSERNVVRRVLDLEQKRESLIVTVLRFGQARATRMEICRTRDRRTPAAKSSARAAYQALLRRVLEREFSGHTLERLTASMDLERSFGPVHARGVLQRGSSWTAVLGVNGQELQASIDGSLTFGLLWLDYLRKNPGRCVVEGLSIFAPSGSSAVIRARMAHLAMGAAKWRLFELDERAGELQELDTSDAGNLQTRLVHCPDDTATRERFADSITRIRMLAPAAEVAVLTPGEVAFRLHGLEFARARMAQQEGSFKPAEELVFGVGAEETVVTDETWGQFTALVKRVVALRKPASEVKEPLWRACPERWLESLVVKDVSTLEPCLDASCVYSQVPAFAAGDRAMIDVVAATREGRLAVIELKADEDIHLPLQGLDYWARVRWHQQRGEFAKFGYFQGRELSAEGPLLMLVAPALRIHPSTDTVLSYLSREIEWQLIAVDERWREGVKVVFRKHREKQLAAEERG
ncbi:MAG: hypothetical protein ACR2IF_01645 [Terriglobales bacterium]